MSFTIQPTSVESMELTKLTDSTGGDRYWFLDMGDWGYDKESNMKGKQCVQEREVLSINPEAFYTPCSAHSVKLVVNDAASGLYSADFFRAVYSLFITFSPLFFSLSLGSVKKAYRWVWPFKQKWHQIEKFAVHTLKTPCCHWHIMTVCCWWS